MRALAITRRPSTAEKILKNQADLSPLNHRRLRIAQLAPLYERVPPRLYGGTERMVSYITEELVRRGHEVTLFASGDSRTSARLVPCCDQALRLSGKPQLGASFQLAMLAQAYDNDRERFDLVHSHIDYWSFPFSGITGTPTVTTMHGRMDVEDLHPVYQHFPQAAIVSISDSQRLPLPNLNWVATVYHGLPRDLLRFNPRPGQYLAFIGRISPEKRPDLAIEVARRSGIPLKIAAKVDVVDREYFETVIKPLIRPPHVEYIGEVNDVEKSEFLGGARALLFPIDWPEPFGLAMVEALACGTPVIARPYGSVPEVMKPGVSGIVADGIDEMVAAVHKVESLPREQCRAYFEERFTVEKMVDKYEQVYARLIGSKQTAPRIFFEQPAAAR
jgi:glycosyltransferase involved in cell wall biosynthesis